MISSQKNNNITARFVSLYFSIIFIVFLAFNFIDGESYLTPFLLVCCFLSIVSYFLSPKNKMHNNKLVQFWIIVAITIISIALFAIATTVLKPDISYIRILD